MAAGVWWARHGLTPFRLLRERLMAIRAGQERRIEGWYPAEVQPLIDNLNALLEDRERAVKRALATAGDLAHCLKTPLALLAQEADENIAQQVDRMSRQVNYHLARARAAASGASGTARCNVAESTEALVRTLLKLYAGSLTTDLVDGCDGPFRTGASGGSRRNAREPPGQRLQMGELESRRWKRLEVARCWF
jgi:signal transduction histidine kinase